MQEKESRAPSFQGSGRSDGQRRFVETPKASTWKNGHSNGGDSTKASHSSEPKQPEGRHQNPRKTNYRGNSYNAYGQSQAPSSRKSTDPVHGEKNASFSNCAPYPEPQRNSSFVPPLPRGNGSAKSSQRNTNNYTHKGDVAKKPYAKNNNHTYYDNGSGQRNGKSCTIEELLANAIDSCPKMLKSKSVAQITQKNVATRVLSCSLETNRWSRTSECSSVTTDADKKSVKNSFEKGMSYGDVSKANISSNETTNDRRNSFVNEKDFSRLSLKRVNSESSLSSFSTWSDVCKKDSRPLDDHPSSSIRRIKSSPNLLHHNNPHAFSGASSDTESIEMASVSDKTDSLTFGISLESIEKGLKKASRNKQSGEITGREEKNIKAELVKSCSLNDHTGVCKVLESLTSVDEESNFLDNEDTHSDSATDTTCSSPRSNPSASFESRYDHLEVLPELEKKTPSGYESTSDNSSVYNFDSEEDQSFELLEKVNKLEEDFWRHREFEETTALNHAIAHASHQHFITPQLEQALNIAVKRGNLDDVRDILYQRCHLQPAVRTLNENSPSSPEEYVVNDHFLNYVDEIAPTDSTESRYLKLAVLQLLSNMVTKWVKFVGKEKGLSPEQIAMTNGSLYLAGSYRLGLNDPSSDIDAVCVAPWHVNREDFFGSFVDFLRKTDDVTHLAPVPHASVPLISLVYHGVSLDLLFARLPMTTVGIHQEIDSDHILNGVDPASMKSLNAPRVSTLLLCLVPKKEVFRVVLRAVRTWAKRRGIYSSKLGYLGGVSWAILVAFVCQLYPDAQPAKVFLRFFQVLSEWRWPDPIMLNMVYDAGLGFEMWDPRKNVYDRSHIMPIITPSYPPMNSAVQVSQSTFSVILEEMLRAKYLAEQGFKNGYVFQSVCQDQVPAMSPSYHPIVKHPSSSTSSTSCQVSKNGATCQGVDLNPWKNVFVSSNFFLRYNSYFVLNFSAGDIQEMDIWGKFVQSRVRKLVESLYHLPRISRVHAFPRYFQQTSDGISPGSCVFLGLEFNRNGSKIPATSFTHKDDPEITRSVDSTWNFFAATDLHQFGNRSPAMNVACKLLTWDDLPDFVFAEGRESARLEREQMRVDYDNFNSMNHRSYHRNNGGYRNHYQRTNRWRNNNSSSSRRMTRTYENSGTFRKYPTGHDATQPCTA